MKRKIKLYTQKETRKRLFFSLVQLYHVVYVVIDEVANRRFGRQKKIFQEHNMRSYLFFRFFLYLNFVCLHAHGGSIMLHLLQRTHQETPLALFFVCWSCLVTVAAFFFAHLCPTGLECLNRQALLDDCKTLSPALHHC